MNSRFRDIGNDKEESKTALSTYHRELTEIRVRRDTIKAKVTEKESASLIQCAASSVPHLGSVGSSWSVIDSLAFAMFSSSCRHVMLIRRESA